MAAVRCNFSLEGPSRPSGVVAWRRRCKNKTTDPSGYCHQHRSVLYGRFYGGRWA